MAKPQVTISLNGQPDPEKVKRLAQLLFGPRDQVLPPPPPPAPKRPTHKRMDVKVDSDGAVLAFLVPDEAKVGDRVAVHIGNYWVRSGGTRTEGEIVSRESSYKGPCKEARLLNP